MGCTLKEFEEQEAIKEVKAQEFKKQLIENNPMEAESYEQIKLEG